MIFEAELRLPDLVRIESESEVSLLESSADGSWQDLHTAIYIERAADRCHIKLRSEKKRIERISLSWKCHVELDVRLLNDAWERGYGELEWAGLSPNRCFPWYFLANRGSETWAIGIRTVPTAFCHWRVSSRELTLVCDVRSGCRGVDLGRRTLPVATVVMGGDTDGSPFHFAGRFCRTMCDPVSLPKEPVIGFNDWNYGYGHNTPETVMRDTQLLVELAPDGPNRPFFMIDAGWQVCGDANGGPWDRGNRLFGDMKKVAERIRGSGARPGIWIRPLRTHERLPEAWLRGRDEHGIALDPSVPEVLETIAVDVARIAGDWGFEMIKHDFTSYDIFGRWGFAMGSEMAGERTMSFQDNSRTTAEIVRKLYETIRAAAGSSLLDGCNVFGHLAPGCADLQRTGDDTSGNDWARTRKMGVNALAFRMPQHRAFFLSDADCVGITRKIPWELNRQWLEVLAGSGTPLLISAAPDAVGPEQKKVLREAYLLSSQRQTEPVAEPLDWMDSRTPSRWKMGEQAVCFDWFEGS